VGFEGVFPILGHCTVYASLCQVVCDSLALNGLFGLVESFSRNYFCSICYATSDEIQYKFTEEQLKKRTVDEYQKDIAGLSDAHRMGKSHCRGVKRECILNQIEGFHITQNWSQDIMHVLLEGIVPVELGCILYGLCISSDKCQNLTLERINKEMQLLWGKITVEKTHKPAQIMRLQEPGHAIVPSIKAV
jgi:hypothetical protein